MRTNLTKRDYVSTAGDLSYIFGALALLLSLVGCCTPAWIDTHLDVASFIQNNPEATGELNPTTYIAGRGFFQAYEYNGYGIITLIPFFTSDPMGKLDPFCGSANAESSFPVLQVINDLNITGISMRGRDYNRGDWCHRRNTATVFVIASILFSLCAMLATYCAQKGKCEQTPYLVLIGLVFILALISCSIMGSFITEEDARVNDTPVNERFFPMMSNTKIGYSFFCYLFGMLAYGISFILALLERCCHPPTEAPKRKSKQSGESSA